MRIAFEALHFAGLRHDVKSQADRTAPDTCAKFLPSTSSFMIDTQRAAESRTETIVGIRTAFEASRFARITS
jgi:hypothetical protein